MTSFYTFLVASPPLNLLLADQHPDTPGATRTKSKSQRKAAKNNESCQESDGSVWIHNSPIIKRAKAASKKKTVENNAADPGDNNPEVFNAVMNGLIRVGDRISAISTSYHPKIEAGIKEKKQKQSKKAAFFR